MPGQKLGTFARATANSPALRTQTALSQGRPPAAEAYVLHNLPRRLLRLAKCHVDYAAEPFVTHLLHQLEGVIRERFKHFGPRQIKP